MAKKITTLLVVSFLIFICMQQFFSYMRVNFADNGVIVLTGSVILTAISIPFIIGLIIGIILSKYFEIDNSDDEVKIVGGGVVGFSFVSGICFSGACFPAAVFGSLFSFFYIIPILFGIKFSTYLKI